MFPVLLRPEFNPALQILGWGLLTALAAAWMAFSISRAPIASGSLVCEARGRAGAVCHQIAATEPRQACESFGRGGRICYASQE